jgi:threonine/homoserine/homoserine lactone efflux protein
MSDLPLFLTALAVAFLVPGPDMILMIETGASRGRPHALATAAGLALARVGHVLLSAVGLAALFRASPIAFDLVRWAGAAYLAFLGVKILTGPSLIPAEGDGTDVRGSLAAGFRRGLATSALNPKAYLFASVLLPQFVHPGAGAVGVQFALLGAILVGVGFAFDAGFGFAGTAVGRFARGHRLAERVQRWVFGTVLIGFGLRLAAA